MVKCIIFDCDGTLVDSEYLCHLALEAQLKEYGVCVSAAKLVREFRAWKLDKIIADLQKDFDFQPDSDFIPCYRSKVADLFEKSLAPCEGVIDALESIDLPRCVASNGPLEKMQHALLVSGLSQYFSDNLFSAYDIGSWKPEPELFLHSASKMGFEPNECVVVEDSDVGISAAKAAGIPAILYDPLEIYGPQSYCAKIKSMTELSNEIYS